MYSCSLNFVRLVPILLFCAQYGAEKTPSVIIIGAGPAGIAAASKLLENSITDIKILEAENRIGGRIHSVKFGDAFVDLGAEYCHGQDDNTVYKMVKDLGILTSDFKYSNQMYYSNGSKLDDAFVSEFVETLDWEDNGSVKTTDDMSIGDQYVASFNATFNKKYGNDPEKLKLGKELLKLADGLISSIEGSFSWNEPAATSSYETSKGNVGQTWKGTGYKIILDVLTKAYPNPNEKLPIDDKIQTGTKAQLISWNQTHGVTVTTENGTLHKADHVIFTPSIGVLKAQIDSLFSPPLPSYKRNALDSLGFGAVMKIILRYDQGWWGNTNKAVFLLWSAEEMEKNYPEFPWVKAIDSIVQAPENPKVLVAWVTGNEVKEMEKLPVETLKQGCQFLINKFMGKDYPEIPEIKEIIRSTWWSNPNFLGTYSYEKKGASQEANLQRHLDLAQPLTDGTGSPSVLFAGEASSPTHFSTVHGAIETGFREADRIIALSSKD